MQDFDASAVVKAARVDPAPGWVVFPWRRVVAVVWLVARLAWALLVMVIAAIAVLALEVVAIDDPNLPWLLVGLWVVFAVMFGFGPVRALATGGRNVLVVAGDGVAWREGSRVVGFGFSGLLGVHERVTAGQGLSHVVELVYAGGRVLLVDHRRFGSPGEIAGAVARQAGVERVEHHGRVHNIN